ncbi:hypothetical protein CLF_112639 [Clonorchis sinensis]|uniref:Uncharacterized protein n=1 Tax=Clonorchis sinensis TaxID=79923 RepID=G7YWQ2_CLOSI|nr:hypothetical protein CLF_112639 [Clonorchis sinensis]
MRCHSLQQCQSGFEYPEEKSLSRLLKQLCSYDLDSWFTSGKTGTEGTQNGNSVTTEGQGSQVTDKEHTPAAQDSSQFVRVENLEGDEEDGHEKNATEGENNFNNRTDIEKGAMKKPVEEKNGEDSLQPTADQVNQTGYHSHTEKNEEEETQGRTEDGKNAEEDKQDEPEVGASGKPLFTLVGDKAIRLSRDVNRMRLTKYSKKETILMKEFALRSRNFIVETVNFCIDLDLLFSKVHIETHAFQTPINTGIISNIYQHPQNGGMIEQIERSESSGMRISLSSKEFLADRLLAIN